MTKTTSLLRAKIWLLFAILLWASAFVGIRAGLQGYSPGGLALLRFLIASLCMLIAYVRLPKVEVIPLRDKIKLLIVGMFAVGCYNITLNYGEVSVPSGIASFIISQSPIVTVICAILFLREQINSNLVLGMMVSFGGLTLILLGGEHQFDFHVGVLFVMAATFIGGVYSVLQKPFLRKYHATEVTAYVMWGATILLLIYTPQMLHEVTTASFSATASAIYLGIFPAAIGYIAWSHGLNAMPVSKAANYLYFMPIAATLIGWVWLRELPTWLSLLGGLIALAGVWIVNHPRSLVRFR